MLKPCSIQGCPKPRRRNRGQGFCEMHYTRVLRHGDPHVVRSGTGERNPAWRGGRTKDKQGYIYCWLPPGDPLRAMAPNNCGLVEHRLVMARHLGRLLASHETVHHKNGVRDDNRIENLELRQGHHGQGQRWRCVDCGSNNVEAA